MVILHRKIYLLKGMKEGGRERKRDGREERRPSS